MEESFPMKGGDGQYSYRNNSNAQKEAADQAKLKLEVAIIENLDIENVTPTSYTFSIADLGCSVGPNTFIAVNNIIEAVKQSYKTKFGKLNNLPDFQVYFNDHTSNDFNLLFSNLPNTREYFAAGVPGSFYNKLFPKSSLNFVYSAFAIQWLSKVPQELSDLNSPLCNKGRIHYANAPNEVGKAYYSQYEKDMEIFLQARAQELVPGGLMTILTPGRRDGNLPAQTSLGPFFLPLETSIVDLANEGILSKEALDLFNVPMYYPSKEELQTQITRNGCFSIVKVEEYSPEFLPLVSAQQCRAGFENIITKNFGHKIMEQVFERYSNKIAGLPPLVANDGTRTGFFVILKHNH
ncbi:putative S-adenosylmethionine-dependent methyltransferase [Quillaja saponaria]|uniref:S-adenosylmethionine-dependent methyltransferase n=1 Tax=Quillaja saponaria TaxID=32244 RepID=A0AAD7PX33_QUISA|nr:putative S-adenosylmethionine-dependent methyltransferase [Quillaja saponaria]